MTQDGPPPEELLARFRERGEVEALGALFDVTSPTLFRMALTLSPDPASAEDAVQETFLTLMASGSHYDPSRPLLPWMVGILQLKVHEVRRRARRTVDPARLAPPVFPDDPALMAETGEEVERVRAALDALPEPYRAVAILRWRYGLEPAAIADARNEPPGTIRSLLHRAQEKLRSSLRALPAFLLADRVPRGMDAVRATVMAKGAAVTTAAVVTAAVAVASGGVLMSLKTMVVAAVVLVLGGAAWFSFGLDRVRPVYTTSTPMAARTPPPPVAAPSPVVAETVPDPPPGPDPSTLPPPVDLSKCDRDLDLFGTVVDEVGRPVPGARVEVVTHPARHWNSNSSEDYYKEEVGPTTVSAADGTFSLRLARGDQVDLRALADGYGRGDQLGCLAGERVLLVMRIGGATVEVTVLDDDRRPVPDARVVLVINSERSYYRHSALVRRGTTDDRGRCVFPHLRPGQAAIAIEHDVLDHPESSHPIVPVSGVLSLEYTMHRGRTVSGRVTDASTGLPVPGARVGSSYGQARGMTTDAEGRYSVPGVTKEGRRGLGASAKGYGSQLRMIPDSGDVDFALEPAFEVVGRLVAASGGPLAGERVVVSGFDKGKESWAYDGLMATTDGDGRFRIGELSRRCFVHYLVIESRGHGLVATSFPPPPEGERDIDLGDVVMASPRSIEGSARDAGGNPIPGADVSAFRFKGPGDPKSEDLRDVAAQGTGKSCRTDDLGRFRFPDLGPGRWNVRLAMPSAPIVEIAVELTADADILDVVLAQKGGSLSFLVTDGGGRPIPGISIQSDMVFPHSSGSGGAGSINGITDAGGRARFTAIPEIQVGKERGVRFQVQPIAGASAPPWAGVRTEPLIPAGQEVHVILKPVSSIRGKVIGPSGDPVRDVVVSAFDLSGQPIGGAADFADDRGEFTVRVGEGVTAVLKLTGEGGAAAGPGGTFTTGRTPWRGESEGVRAPAEGLVLQATKLSVDGGLDLVVLDIELKPVAGYQVVAWRSGESRSGRSDGLGRIHWEGMIEETWHLMPYCILPRGMPDESVPPAAMDVVPAGQEVLLRFRKGVAVEGIVLLPDGSPASGAYLGFNLKTGGGGPCRPPRSDEHGRFKLWFGEGDEFRIKASWIDGSGSAFQGESQEVKPGSGVVEIRLALQ